MFRIVVCSMVSCGFCCIFFFFKQKTAYEMRISDWSSDVCSSDLGAMNCAPTGFIITMPWKIRVGSYNTSDAKSASRERSPRRKVMCALCGHALKRRSEEHTYELQSLMRISYAVFCLKKKKEE